MSTVGTLSVILNAVTTRFNRGMDAAVARIAAFKARFGGLQSMMMAGVGFYAIKRAIGSSMTSFASFEKQMAEVSTMLDVGAMQYMPRYTSAIKRMAIEYGEATSTLAKGAYDLLSASVDPAKAMEVLEIATRAAKGGVTDTSVAVDGLTSMLNAFQLSATEATHVSDLMFATVKSGKINFAQLSSNIGKVAPMAKVAGMSMETMLAAISTMTRQGLSAEQATTRLSAVMRNMPGDVKDLANAMMKFKGMDLAQIMEIIPESRAASGIAALSSDLEGLRRDMTLMANSTGMAQAAFEKMQTSAETLAKIREAVTSLFRDMGEALAPALNAVSNGIKNNLGVLREWFQGIGKGVKNVLMWIQANAALTLTLVKVGAGVLAAILILPMLLGAIKAIAAAIGFLMMHPVMLLLTGVAMVIAAFVDWGSAMDGLKSKMGIKDPMKDISVANKANADAMKQEQDAMNGKLSRLGELQSQQRMTNVETIEARTLAYDLTKAYPQLAAVIDQVGKSTKAAADAAKLLDEAQARQQRTATVQARTSTRIAIGELDAQIKAAEEAARRIPELEAMMRMPSAKVLAGMDPNSELGRAQVQLEAAYAQVNALDELRNAAARAKDEYERLNAALGVTSTGAAVSGATPVDKVKSAWKGMVNVLGEAKNAATSWAMQTAREIKKVSEPLLEATKSIRTFNDNLKTQMATYGMTDRQGELYKMKQGAGDVPAEAQGFYNTMLQETIRLMEELDKKDAMKAAAEKAAQAAESIHQSGRQMWEQTRTPLENYEAELVRLNDMLAAGALSQDIYNRAIKAAKDRMDEVGGKGTKTDPGQFQASRTSLIDTRALNMTKDTDKVATKLDESKEVLIDINKGIRDLVSKEGLA